MVRLANGFAERGHAVDLVLAQCVGAYLHEISDEVSVVDLNAGRVSASLPGLIRYLRRERPSAMLTALTHVNIAAIVARALARVPTRLVISERNALSQCARRGRKERLILCLMRPSYRFADAIVAVSDGVANDLVSLGLPKEKIHRIYNPAYPEAFLAKARAPVRNPRSKADQPPVVLAVGRLTAQKDFPTLLRAFKKVRAERRLRLIILGEGDHRPQLEAMARKLKLDRDVEMPGFAEDPFSYMRNAKLFVLSSRYEGFPNVIVEAMACGTQVVSTDCRHGPREILENGRWGRLVPVGDAEELAAAIVASLDNPDPPDVTIRAKQFGVRPAVDAYLSLLTEGTPSTSRSRWS